MKESLSNLKQLGREIYLMQHAQAVLEWDMETQMPEDGAEERAEQLALFEGLTHRKITSPEIGRLLSFLGAEEGKPEGKGDFDTADKAFVREMFRLYSHASKLPESLVTELAKQTGISHQVWVEARKKADFSIFEDSLTKIYELNHQKAEKLGYKEHPYDALLDEYEPWMTAAEVEKVFTPLAAELSALVADIKKAGAPDSSFLEKSYPTDLQDQFGRMLIGRMGYPEKRGRLDISAHPFTTTLGADDVRITTRYDEKLVMSGVFSNIHECGHALYELGVGDNLKGGILGTGVSLGIHESQSRFWENLVGRSLPFWKHFYPEFSKLFPEQTKGVDVETFYKAVNKVTPSFIRIEADEVTYSLHVVLRFELEKEVLAGNLKVSDLPDEWNRRMKKFLGITPANDSEGVLQDVHWSAGLIGYFPTYALGNLYGAQFLNSMKKQLGDVDGILESGDLGTILGWLRENIHSHGMVYPASELCRRVTGEDLNAAYFTDYLRDKFGGIYGLRGN